MAKKQSKKKPVPVTPLPSKGSLVVRSNHQNRRIYTDIQRAEVLQILDDQEGNLQATARLTGISARTIRDWRDKRTVILRSDDPELIEAILMTKEQVKAQMEEMSISIAYMSAKVQVQALDALSQTIEKNTAVIGNKADLRYHSSRKGENSREVAKAQLQLH